MRGLITCGEDGALTNYPGRMIEFLRTLGLRRIRRP